MKSDQPNAVLPWIVLAAVLSGPHMAAAQVEVNDRLAAQAGIRKIAGRHIDLYTDIPAQAAVDELPRVFDAAVPLWCDYFAIDTTRTRSWRVKAFLVDNRARFESVGLIPADLPPFLHGYQRGSDLWVVEQPSDYYRRHLLLHEGTHAFMNAFLGGCGPPWYMEGMAEWLGTHRWSGGRLQLKHFPQSRAETELWGRIKIVNDEVRQGRGLSLGQIMRYGPTDHRRIEPYGWCWAAVAFFDSHPAYQDAFRRLRHTARETGTEFSGEFDLELARSGSQLAAEWQWFILNLEYGHDIVREAFVRRPVEALPDSGRTVTVRADRGWQSAGIRLEAAVPYQFAARGRYQVGNQPGPWWCEPGGVTIRYHGGRPLGVLLAAVFDESAPREGQAPPLVEAEAIGLGRTVTFPRGGTLFLRINDSPAELADNEGQLQVDVRVAR